MCRARKRVRFVYGFPGWPPSLWQFWQRSGTSWPEACCGCSHESRGSIAILRNRGMLECIRTLFRAWRFVAKSLTRIGLRSSLDVSGAHSGCDSSNISSCLSNRMMTTGLLLWALMFLWTIRNRGRLLRLRNPAFPRPVDGMARCRTRSALNLCLLRIPEKGIPLPPHGSEALWSLVFESVSPEDDDGDSSDLRRF